MSMNYYGFYIAENGGHISVSKKEITFNNKIFSFVLTVNYYILIYVNAHAQFCNSPLQEECTTRHKTYALLMTN